MSQTVLAQIITYVTFEFCSLRQLLVCTDMSVALFASTLPVIPIHYGSLYDYNIVVYSIDVAKGDLKMAVRF